MFRVTIFFCTFVIALAATNAALADVATSGHPTTKVGRPIVTSDLVLRCMMTPGGGSCGSSSGGGGGGGGGGSLPDMTCTTQTEDGGTNCNADGPIDPGDPNPTAAPHSGPPTPKASASSSQGTGFRPGVPPPVGKLPNCAVIHATNVHYCTTVAAGIQKFCTQQIPRMDFLCAHAGSA